MSRGDSGRMVGRRGRGERRRGVERSCHVQLNRTCSQHCLYFNRHKMCLVSMDGDSVCSVCGWGQCV